MEALTEPQRDDLKEIFSKVSSPTSSTDPTPCVAAKELGFVLRSMGVFSSESEIRDMISEVDTTGSGLMCFEEFANLMCRSIKAEAEPFMEITDAFDEIGDKQFVSKQNLIDAIRSVGVDITEEEVSEMVAEADIDGNGGRISREDFKYLMETRHKSVK